jgi:hypothetical protein
MPGGVGAAAERDGAIARSAAHVWLRMRSASSITRYSNEDSENPEGACVRAGGSGGSRSDKGALIAATDVAPTWSVEHVLGQTAGGCHQNVEGRRCAVAA